MSTATLVSRRHATNDAGRPVCGAAGLTVEWPLVECVLCIYISSEPNNEVEQQ